MSGEEWRAKNIERVRAHKRKWYERNKSKFRVYSKKRSKENYQFIQTQKLGKTCSKCPENHPAALDFHHIHPEQKRSSLSSAAAKGWSKSHILEEITKCELLCSNCHRKLHWTERQKNNK